MSCGQNTCGGIKWVGQQVGIIGGCEVASDSGFSFECSDVVTGVQTFGYDPSFESTPFFQFGQSEIYELREGVPVINITMSKALDGHSTIYTRATKDAQSPTLIGRAATKCAIGAAIFPCDRDSAAAAANSVVVFSGAQVNSVSYSFGVDNVFTEEVSFVSNDMIWKNNASIPANTTACDCTPTDQFTAEVATISFTGCNAANDQAPRAPLQFREHIIFGHSGSSVDINGALADPDTTILPPDIYGINCSGTNDSEVCIQSIAISAQLNREDINCLGTKGPRNRTITLPVAVETAINVITERDALVSATTYGVCQNDAYDDCVDDARCAVIGTNQKNRTIRVATCDGLRVYTGIRNKLSGISRSGGGTDGSNVNVTYNFRTYNTMTVLHCADQSSIDNMPSGTAWWSDRDTWLTDV